MNDPAERALFHNGSRVQIETDAAAAAAVLFYKVVYWSTFLFRDFMHFLSNYCFSGLNETGY